MRNAFRFSVGTMGVMALVFLAAGTARADWAPGDPFKMTVPQLPDPNGLDIDMRIPRVLADDWLCSETGPVSDVHFWISVQGTTAPIPPSQLQAQLGPLFMSFHENVPAGPTGTPPSHPGQTIRGYVLPPTEYFVNPTVFTGQQGWYDPAQNQYIPVDHLFYYQVNVPRIPDPFIQQVGNIYWLDLSFQTTLPVGWKTSLDQFDARPPNGRDDDAVWAFRNPTDPFGFSTPTSWIPMTYPEGHPLFPQSLNLAFVITPEPGVALLAIGGVFGLGLMRRR